MRAFKLFFLLFFLSQFSNAEDFLNDSFSFISAKRNSGEDYKEYLKKYEISSKESLVHTFENESKEVSIPEAVGLSEAGSLEPDRRNALKRAEAFEKLSFDFVPEAFSLEVLSLGFQEVRDSRFLKHDSSFPRRISWLFPDDGCFVRADFMIKKLKEYGYEFKKVFLFGNLEVETKNTFSNKVSWWYHVAPVIRVGEKLYVLDPSIEPERPLELSRWVLRQTDSLEKIEIAICSDSTYSPGSQCEKGREIPFEKKLAVQELFLEHEWHRQITLDRDPEVVLGNSPPWRN